MRQIDLCVMTNINFIYISLASLAVIGLISETSAIDIDAVVISRLRFALRKVPQPAQCEHFCRGVSSLAKSQVVVVDKFNDKADIDMKLLGDVVESLRKNESPAVAAYLSDCMKKVQENRKDRANGAGVFKNEAKGLDKTVETEKVEPQPVTPEPQVVRPEDVLNLKRELKRLKRELETAEQREEQSNKHLKELQAQMDTKSLVDAKGLADEINRLNQELDAMRNQFDFVLQREQMESKKLKDLQARFDTEAEKNRATLEGRKKEISALNTVVSTLETSLSDKDKSEARLRQQVGELKGQMEEQASVKERDSMGLNESMASLQRELDEARKARERSAQQVKDLQNKLDQSENKSKDTIKNLEDKVAASDKLSKSWKLKVEESEASIATLKNKITELESQKQCQITRLNAQTNDYITLKKKVADLEKELTSANQQSKVTNLQITEAQSHLTICNSEKDKALKEINLLRSQLEDVKQQEQSSRLEFRECQSSAAANEKKQRILLNERDEMLVSVNKIVDDLRSSLSASERRETQLKQQVADAQALSEVKSDGQATEIATLKMSNELMRSQLAAALKKNDESIEQIKSQADKIVMLTGDVDLLKKRLDFAIELIDNQMQELLEAKDERGKPKSGVSFEDYLKMRQKYQDISKQLELAIEAKESTQREIDSMVNDFNDLLLSKDTLEGKYLLLERRLKISTVYNQKEMDKLFDEFNELLNTKDKLEAQFSSAQEELNFCKSQVESASIRIGTKDRQN